MLILADTGILLRLADRGDHQHVVVREAVRTVRSRGDGMTISSQNAAEFWNVCTRPSTSRGGWGLTITEAERRVALIEGAFSVLVDPIRAYRTWRDLVVTHAVRGRQVHDARIVALMHSHGIKHVMTLNIGDFARYPGIVELAPADLTAATPPSAP